jgi:hypothetical protein
MKIGVRLAKTDWAVKTEKRNENPVSAIDFNSGIHLISILPADFHNKIRKIRQFS